MHIQKNNITPMDSYYYILHPVIIKIYSALLTADFIPLCMKNPIPKWWLAFPFP
jgi:hypothetical protein